MYSLDSLIISLPVSVRSAFSSLIVLIVKVITITFDLLTIVGQVIWQRPWKTINDAKRVRSVREDINDPNSPFVRAGDPIPFTTENLLEGPTIGHWFDSMVKNYGDSKCLATRTILSQLEEKQPDGKLMKKFILSDQYSYKSYKQVDQEVKKIIHGLISNGIKPGDKVILFCETREEWFLTALAIWKLGAIAVTMYANLGLDGICHILEQTKATLMVTSADCLGKLSAISDQINHLKVIFCANDPTARNFQVPSSLQKFKFIHFDQLTMITETNSQSNGKYLEPEDIVLIMYTSGSTGIPKGVQLSNENFICSLQGFLTSAIYAHEPVPHDAYLAYLPLAHMFEMAAEMLMFSMGIPIHYSSPRTMFDSSTAIAKGCKGDLTIVRPTILATVPLILDRMKKSIEDKMSTSGLINDLFQFTFNYKKFWYQFGFETPLMDSLMFRKVRQTLGGHVKMMFAGGAPLSTETQEFITLVFGIKLLQGYAATEATACGSLMDLGDQSLGRCGAPLFGVKVKLINWPEGNYRNTDKPNPRGELVLGGPSVSMGYYMNEKETEAAFYIDKDGVRWWKSGDIGEIFPDGTIKIIDRKKDLVKLQHGEYISLGKVESVLKNCPYIDNICVYGDSFHNYLIAFVLPERKSLKKLAQSLGLTDSTNYETLCSNAQLVSKVLETLRDFGQSKGLLKMEIPNRIKLCPEEWTPDNGLVTAALKIRRLQIQQFYKQSIEKLYLRS